MTPENAQKKAVLDLLAAHRIPAWRRNTGAHSAEYTTKAGVKKRRFVRYSEPGQSDVWGILSDGRHLEVEVKRPGDKPTEAQFLWLTTVVAAGGVGIWCDSPEMLIEKLKAEGLI